MAEPIINYGLLLRTENEYGASYLVAEIVKREGDHHAPRNVGCSWPWDQSEYMDGLAMRGFVSDTEGHSFLGYEPEFYNQYTVDERKAKRIVKTLRRVNARIEKDAAQTAPDMMMSLCVALRLAFVVERIGDGRGASSYDDNRWRWMSVGDGRNRYRQMIEDMRTAKKAAA